MTQRALSEMSFDVQLEGTSVDDAVEKVREALAAEGFGILTTIDVAATFEAKLGISREPYRILGACNPQLAKRAIDANPSVGLLLPCNVVVRAEGEGAVVELLRPRAMFSVASLPEGMEEVADEAEAKIGRVADALSKG